MVPELIFEKRGVLALIALESLSTIMNRGIVVVKLGFVDCGKGTAITEVSLPMGAGFVLMNTMLPSHVLMKELIPRGEEITSLTG